MSTKHTKLFSVHHMLLTGATNFYGLNQYVYIFYEHFVWFENEQVANPFFETLVMGIYQAVYA